MTVSVLVPIYNVEKYISRCAISLFEQTYRDIEYVFVDDCSSDKSLEALNHVIQQYPDREVGTTIIRHSFNRGLAAARNTAIECCTGDFLIHVDPDDYLSLDAVEKLVKRQVETGADIVTGQVIRLSNGMMTMMERPQFNNHDDLVEDMIILTIHHAIWGRLIRKALYTKHHIRAKEGVDIGEDMQVMASLTYYAQKVESVWDVVYYYEETNEKSYMNQYDHLSPFRLCQDTASMEVVRDFFVGKNERFQNVTERYLYDYYWTLLEILGKDITPTEFTAIKRLLAQLRPLNCKKSVKRQIKASHYLIFIAAKHLAGFLLKQKA